MKVCPNCGSQFEDDTKFCTSCGFNFSEVDSQPQQPENNYNPQYDNNYAQQGNNNYYQPPQYAPVDPFDHTAEFNPKDISENKVFAMLIYLMGAVGIIIALLASNNSEYVRFHLRQGMKIIVSETLLGIAAVLLCWTFIVPTVASVMIIILFVIKIISFFQICSGKAKEPAIIRNLNFLK